MADPTIVYFGQYPTTISMQTSNAFNGGAQTGTPTLSPGHYEFPSQAGGGHYNFHTEPVDVKNITFKGTGTLSIRKVFRGVEAEIATIGNGAGEFFENTTLSPGESLKFYSTHAGTVCITGALAGGPWTL